MRTIDKLVFQFVALAALAVALFTLPGQAQTEKIIYSFGGGTDGAIPEDVILDANGNLYGTVETGGANGGGGVFELSPNTSGGWTKTMLYSFSFTGSDVALPASNLVFDTKGNLYGISAIGGAHGSGGIFELSPGTGGVWTEKVIYSFAGGSDVVSFQSSLAIDGAGNLYSYRASTSSSVAGTYGAVFELVAGSSGTWSEKILHTFSGGNDGSAQYGGRLAIDSSGNLYGQANGGAHDYGLVFELVHGANGTWSEKVLHTFTGGADGAAGFEDLLLIEPNGNIFGASLWNVFELVRGSNGTWTEKTLHTFSGGGDGAFPDSGMIMDASGKLYGITNEGGAHHGTVFELTPNANGTWSEKILHKFSATGGDGRFPNFATLVMDKQGNLYSATAQGGTSNNGVVFEVTP